MSDESERLQQHSNMMRGEPVIALSRMEAARQAYRLRAKGMHYPSIALVMGIYHGHWYTAGRWRNVCRAQGSPALHYKRVGSKRVPPPARDAA